MSQRIDFSHTFTIGKEIIKQYNDNPVLGKEDKPIICRPGMVHTFERLVKMLAAATNKKPKLFEDGFFPTNNEAIATYTGWSSRTIQSHLKVLQIVGLIVKPPEKWHGSRHGYEIALNPKLYPPLPPSSGAKSVPFAESQRKNFPHKELGTLNNIIDKGNVDKVSDQPHKKGLAIQTLTKLQNSSGNKGNKIKENFSVGFPQREQILQKKGNSSGQQEKTTKRCAALLSLVREYVERLLKICVVDIYHKLPYLTPNQMEIIRYYFYQKLYDCTTLTQVTQLYGELTSRLFMVQGWLNKKPNRYIPLPHVYFDRDRKVNFDNTQAWLDATKDFNLAGEIFRKRRDQHIRKRDKFQFLYKAYQKNLSAW